MYYKASTNHGFLSDRVLTHVMLLFMCDLKLTAVGGIKYIYL